MTVIVTLGTDRSDLDRVIAALDGGSHVAIIAADLVVAERALSPITHDPFAPTSALVAGDRRGNAVVRHHRVVSVGTAFHEVRDPTHKSVGAVVIAPDDCDASRDAVQDLCRALDSGVVKVPQSDMVEAVLVALVRSEVTVRSVEIVDVPWFRSPIDPQQARAAAASVPEPRIAGLLANRVDDGFYSTFVVRKASKPLTRIAISIGLSPNVITCLSFAVGLAAAVAFSSGEWLWIVIGAIALQLSLIIDCVDGEVARATRKFTAVGAWLDASTDRVKEFAVYAGLAIGATRMDLTVFGMNVWWLAVILIVLQTTRHVSDYDFSRIQRLREAGAPRRDIREVDDGRDATSGGLAAAMDASARMNRRSAVRWLKKVVHMPIGERWLLISALAIVAGPAWALGGLLIAGLLALAYVLVGRIVRTITWSGETPGDGSATLAAQLDAGPIAAAIARLVPAARPALTGPFGWGVPVALRAVELGGIAVMVTFSGEVVAAFWILFIIAYHHYDVLYRSLQGARQPRWLAWWGFGWDGRLLVIAAVALSAVLQPALTLLLVWWVLWFAGVASIQWLRSSR
ncbi:MAG: CDP-alcohol phosphatidyltransferase family protein [Candidatus Nanopelagicales bacterium]